MALISKKTAIAVKIQANTNEAATISVPDDLMPCYDLRPQTEAYTVPNPEYTGSADMPGDFVLGRGRTISFNIALRGPGGSQPPAADEWVQGRVLRAARFTEISQQTPLIASTALGGTGTAASAILPSSASADDEFYDGLPIMFSDKGSGVDALTMVRSYDGASKTAQLMEVFDTPPAADVTIPAFLGYRYNAGLTEALLTIDWWHDKKRYRMYNGVVSSFQPNFPVSNRSDTAITYIAVTVTGDVDEIDAEFDEVAPLTPAAGAIPPFRDGKLWLADQDVCGSSVTSDLGLRVTYPPCPNRPNGNEAPLIAETKRTATLNLNEVLLSEQDYNQLAIDQNLHQLWLQYGRTSGKVISYGIPEGRLNYSEPDSSGDIITRSPEMYIDKSLNSMSFMFPYF